jgi:hypothetical protein
LVEASRIFLSLSLKALDIGMLISGGDLVGVGCIGRAGRFAEEEYVVQGARQVARRNPGERSRREAPGSDPGGPRA